VSAGHHTEGPDHGRGLRRARDDGWDSGAVHVTDRRMPAPAGYRLAATLRNLPARGFDPAARYVDGVFWWAARTPGGPGTLRLAQHGDTVEAGAYGAGAAWLLDRADGVAGLRDDVTGFRELARAHPLVDRLAGAHRGLRLPATGLVFPHVLRAVLEQKVSGKEAHRSYRAVVRHFGEPAPGPVPLVLPPDPAAVAATPYWVFHPFGVEQRRASALLRAAAVAASLERCTDSAGATRRLTALPGIGPWTAAEVVRLAYGDPDAVSVGDLHIPNTVAWALAGEPRGTDERMLELLEPFRGQRGRVCELLSAGGHSAPRYGPRMPIRSFAGF
jgi:3-methyladenine DNA glycosylase/8-oxoguanine DNA glycosylase